MNILSTIMLCFAFVFLVLAAIKIPERPNLSYGWLGLAIWLLVVILGGLLKS